MAKYRHISMAFWTDPKVVDDMTPEDRYIYLYCMTNPHTNICGCYEISIKQIARETGYNEDSVLHVLRRLDETHDLIRYCSATKELLILNWHRYNWASTEKTDRVILADIQSVKNDNFREYLAALYNERPTVTEPYIGLPAQDLSAGTEDVTPRPGDPGPHAHPAPPEKRVRRKYGEYGWVRLTDEEYERLEHDLGAEELKRCIAYIDESAQSTGNKNHWKDWNLVIRKASREGWGRGRGNYTRHSAGAEAMDSLQALHRQFDEEGL